MTQVTGAPAETVLEAARDRRSELVELLRRLVERESPSGIPEAQGPIFEILEEELRPLGFRTRRIPGRRSGGQLLARRDDESRSDGRRGYQLLIGHTDTVWPVGTLEEMPIRLEDGRMAGPGIYDMKAGLAQIVLACRILDALDMEPAVEPVVFVNSDEELGSGESAANIRRLARIVDRTFVLEPSLGPAGKLKTARKGVGDYTVEVRGRAAHAGLDPDSGASAILELSHVIQRLFDLNDPERGVTVNVGTIDGGLRPNVVAPRSRAEIDVRVPTREDAVEVDRRIRSLEPFVPGVELEVAGSMGRPPMEPGPGSRELWERARRIGRALGIELEEGRAGGASDGNLTSQYAPTLDGLGAVGDGAHAEHEHVDLERTVERTALLALLLMEPPLSMEAGNDG